MDNRLNYHTSMEGTPPLPTASGIAYHTSLSNTTIAFENLKKINNRLDENNIISLAYLSTNPYISEEEREQFKTQLKEKAKSEYETYQSYNFACGR